MWGGDGVLGERLHTTTLPPFFGGGAMNAFIPYFFFFFFSLDTYFPFLSSPPQSLPSNVSLALSLFLLETE